ncbi:FAD-binding oxidoreductase [Nonomuraea glycinis]|uniref:FAD-linked oxidase n=1 Tax=Nonomuraea glycinis TaxID=2047744 RepID=A0A918A395_9ACTN|nr:FAD-binding oxidoreductase [Nonomuraea glycinis]MCA2180325.1 FAD-binding oxidoreductase [Nonomuraea glycinis]GGP03994.1 FAD-linked oxidase [Nonomuraea glycinis]
MSQLVVNRIDAFRGAVYLPGDEGYEDGRKSLNPAVDARPVMVAEAAGRDDVRAAVVAAAARDLPLAVQATGHGTHVPSDGGILLRTSLLDTVEIDPARRVARVGPGVRWGQVLAAAAPYGLAPLSGSSPQVGVTGYTLGGGVGWLSRRYGFAADSVLSAEVVTAGGQVVTADPEVHGDLFWALRGGGGNFGVVTSLEFKLYPVAQVHAGIAYFPYEVAGETLARYRDWAATAPDEVSTAVMLTGLPDGRRALGIKAMYAGPPERGRQVLRPLWETAGPALVDEMRTIRYADAAMGGTPARYLDFFDTLPDEVIGTLVATGAHATVEIRHWGGAMAAPGPDAGPVGHRDAPFSVIVDQHSPGLAEALGRHGTGGTFLNFLADRTRVRDAYTPGDHTRLAAVKKAYDPGNVFRLNHNIAPR